MLLIEDLASSATVTAIADVGPVGIIIGALMPPLIAVVQRSNWPKGARVAVAVVTSILVGLATTYAAGQLADVEMTVSSVLMVVSLVIAASQTAFNSLWKPAGVVQLVERVTTPGHIRETVEADGCPAADPKADEVE